MLIDKIITIDKSFKIKLMICEKKRKKIKQSNLILSEKYLPKRVEK